MSDSINIPTGGENAEVPDVPRNSSDFQVGALGRVTVNEADGINDTEGGFTGTPPAQPPAAPEDPTGAAIPEKFRNEDGSLNQEALLQSYAELERARTPEPQEGGDPETPPAEGSFDEAMTAYAEEWTQNGGQLTEATLKTIAEKHNVPPAFVQSYMEGEKAKAELAVMKVQGMVGGADKYTEMIQWANKRLGEGETSAFLSDVQGAMLGGNDSRLQSLMSGMEARWQQDIGKAWAPEVTGQMPDGSAIKPFNSREEMYRAQQTAAYRSGDPNVHKEFDLRLAKSKEMRLF